MRDSLLAQIFSSGGLATYICHAIGVTYNNYASDQGVSLSQLTGYAVSLGKVLAQQLFRPAFGLGVVGPDIAVGLRVPQ